MNHVLHIVADTKQITAGAETKPVAFSLLTATQEAEQHVRENQQRASEIGPVLEDILQNRWAHWGLNE